MREKWIDNAKGIAILLVILGHASFGLKGFWNFDFVFGIHLVMFFLLSGYTLKQKEITKDYLNNKFLRLMKPYFYTCTAIVITDVINSCVLGHNMTIIKITNIIGADLLRSFFASGAITSFSSIELGKRIGAIWFLPALFFAILLMQIVIKYASDSIHMGITTSAIAMISLIISRFIWFPFSIQSGMMATFFLWIGYEIKNRNVLSKIKNYHYVIAMVTVLFGIRYNYCGIGFVVADMNDLFFSPIVGLAGCLLIYLFAIKYKGNLFAYIGKLSLIILCTHIYALETIVSYFYKIIARTSLTGNSATWLFIVIEIVVAVLLAMGIDYFNKAIIPYFKSKFVENYEDGLQQNRDISVDVVKGIFIISILMGHFTIDARLRTVIFSCHMMAFVFLSGFFYNQNRSLKDSISKLVRGFVIPYFIFFVFVLLLNLDSLSVSFIKENAIQYILGLSSSKKLFADIPTVGPIFLILMLFMVHLIYIVIDKCVKNEKGKWLAVVCISFLGVLLGRKQYWLPWSFDVACYSIIFFKIGLLFKETGLLDKVKENHALYFILAPVWVYMIYKGGMEIAVRNYGQYGLVIIGSITGILIVYKLAAYLADNVPVVREFLSLAGRNYLIILIIHTLLSGKIGVLLSSVFNPKNIALMCSSISIQLLLAVMVGLFCQKLRKRFNSFE